MANVYKHLFLARSGEPREYTSPSTRGPEFRKPKRQRDQQSTKILRKLDNAWQTTRQTIENRTALSLPTKQGIYLEFESAPDHDLATMSLESRSIGIRLLNIHTVSVPGNPKQTVTLATVYIPVGQETYFLKKVRCYAEEDTKSGKPKNQKLVDSIEDIRLAVLESFWQDELDSIPDQRAAWCEVWLLGDTKDREQAFRSTARQLDIDIQNRVLHFPERTVLLAKADRNQLIELIESCDNISEFRRAKETARFFLGLNNKEQTAWAEDLHSRLQVSKEPSVAATILDTGVNNGHLLLEPIIKDEDCHTINPGWGKEDHCGHGTLMCGAAGYGDLQAALEYNGNVKIAHCLESVKILPPKGSNDPELYGDITIQGVSRVEIQAPHLTHIACMAVTSEDGRDRGRPSSWSAAIDKLTSGYDDNQQRLFIVAAGNINEQQEWCGYPDSNMTNSIHDPGQAWNALTVGERQFDFINATSAATAQAAWMAAQIQTTYPDAWPETIRGLLVHSAQHTDTMKEQFLTSETKTDYARLLRICGYGVPDLDRASACYRNNLTLIAQEEIQPYDKQINYSGYCTKDMNIHELPWPKKVLLGLGETPVSLRITLSYFIEPGPGEVGWKDRYRYASFALRFDLNNVGEDRETFLQRINAAAREDGKKPDSSSGSERWRIGSKGRDQGSIHSDIWKGTAADLSTCNMVGVYPVIGWWRERYWLNRWDRKTRYSLIVSIHTPVQEVDIHTPVANMISTPITVKKKQS